MVGNCDHTGPIKAQELYKDTITTKWAVSSMPVATLVEDMLAMIHNGYFEYEYSIP